MAKCKICKSTYTKKNKRQKCCGIPECRKEMQIKYRQKWRKKNKIWKQSKQRARNLLRKYLETSPIEKVCNVCGITENIEFHHIDYDKPLEVIPLCRKHHLEIHKENGNCYKL